MIRPQRRRFEASPAEASEARAFLRSVIGKGALGAFRNDSELAVSELATNAILHADTPFEVMVVEMDGYVRIEVEDASTVVPMSLSLSPNSFGMLQQVCDRWGFHLVPNGKCVGCERDLPVVEVDVILDIEPDVVLDIDSGIVGAESSTLDGQAAEGRGPRR